MTVRRKFLAATLALPFVGVADAQIPSPLESPDSSRRVLLVGIHPDLVDYSQVPGLNAQKLGAILQTEVARLAALGCTAQWCFIDAEPFAQRKVVEVLATGQFAVVSIGAGVRLPPDNLLLFERVVNAVHHHAPQARICFSKTANDTAEAVQRWLGAIAT